MALGSMCKQLIDVGRLRWLQGRLGLEGRACGPGEWQELQLGMARRPPAAALVQYIPSDVTGENKLLLARV